MSYLRDRAILRARARERRRAQGYLLWWWLPPGAVNRW